MTTDDYYNQHASEFVAATFSVEMERLYQPFLVHLPANARILDVGCGSGRDALTFKRLGYQVEAMDSAEELVQHASTLTGIKVRLQSFYDLEESAKVA